MACVMCTFILFPLYLRQNLVKNVLHIFIIVHRAVSQSKHTKNIPLMILFSRLVCIKTKFCNIWERQVWRFESSDHYDESGHWREAAAYVYNVMGLWKLYKHYNCTSCQMPQSRLHCFILFPSYMAIERHIETSLLSSLPYTLCACST